MYITKITFLLLFFFTESIVAGSSYHVVMTGDSPIVKGGTVNLKATVYNGHHVATGKFQYSWIDRAIPEHKRDVELEGGIDYWNITYNASVYPQGSYVAQVTVKSCMLYLFCHIIGSARYEFEITETLNGNLDLIQKNQTRDNTFVSNTYPVVHFVNVKQSDMDYIKNAPVVTSFWFVDCVYYGLTNDYKFSYNYTKADEFHSVEALVLADFTPLPPPPTTTTTTAKPNVTTAITTTTKKPITTKKPNSTTTTTLAPKTTTLKPTTSTSVSTTKKSVAKRSVGDLSTSNSTSSNVTQKIMVKVNGTLVPYKGSFPFVCNGTRIATDQSKTYGYFQTTFTVKAPVRKVNVTGNNWLQHGELLSLNVQCQGSIPMDYCVDYRKGIFNVTGNETCQTYSKLDECKFPIQRYLAESMQHTIIIIIKNDVSKIVTPVTVTIYKAKTQAQLSVVVVPVAFSLVAVVIVVFGVAYYFQNRSRFVVEVADFNFGQQYSDMEYKTFRERLRDSITNAFTRGPSPSSSEVPVWPPGRKYGSMT